MIRFERQTLRSSRYLRLRVLRGRSFTRWLLAIAMLAMLGQQIAIAAYACGMAPNAMGLVLATAPAASMPAMGDSPAPMHGSSDRLLCQRHCVPDNAARPDVPPASVPQGLLAALPPMLPVVLAAALPAGQTPERRLYRLRASPPATLLFCSLLI